MNRKQCRLSSIIHKVVWYVAEHNNLSTELSRNISLGTKGKALVHAIADHTVSDFSTIHTELY
nr:hypothetical protein [uncultured Sphaerochaeta sp.]